MKAGLVGYSQSGKTTLFNALTELHEASVPGRGQVNLARATAAKREAACASAFVPPMSPSTVRAPRLGGLGAARRDRAIPDELPDKL
jgi:ABC-type cobalamin/Fe3+-siderophores transport system ATPase subunit